MDNRSLLRLTACLVLLAVAHSLPDDLLEAPEPGVVAHQQKRATDARPATEVYERLTDALMQVEASSKTRQGKGKSKEKKTKKAETKEKKKAEKKAKKAKKEKAKKAKVKKTKGATAQTALASELKKATHAEEELAAVKKVKKKADEAKKKADEEIAAAKKQAMKKAAAAKKKADEEIAAAKLTAVIAAKKAAKEFAAAKKKADKEVAATKEAASAAARKAAEELAAAQKKADAEVAAIKQAAEVAAKKAAQELAAVKKKADKEVAATKEAAAAAKKAAEELAEVKAAAKKLSASCIRQAEKSTGVPSPEWWRECLTSKISSGPYCGSANQTTYDPGAVARCSNTASSETGHLGCLDCKIGGPAYFKKRRWEKTVNFPTCCTCKRHAPSFMMKGSQQKKFGKIFDSKQAWGPQTPNKTAFVESTCVDSISSHGYFTYYSTGFGKAELPKILSKIIQFENSLKNTTERLKKLYGATSEHVTNLKHTVKTQSPKLAESSETSMNTKQGKGKKK